MPCRSRGPGPGGPRLRLVRRCSAGEPAYPACIRFQALAGLASLDSAAPAEALRLLAAASAGPRLLGVPAPRPLAPVCSAPPAPEPPASRAPFGVAAAFARAASAEGGFARGPAARVRLVHLGTLASAPARRRARPSPFCLKGRIWTADGI